MNNIWNRLVDYFFNASLQVTYHMTFSLLTSIRIQ